jgi:hypothetical protein
VRWNLSPLVPICSPQIPPDLTQDVTRRRQQLSARATARPTKVFTCTLFADFYETLSLASQPPSHPRLIALFMLFRWRLKHSAQRYWLLYALPYARCIFFSISYLPDQYNHICHLRHYLTTARGVSAAETNPWELAIDQLAVG